MRKALAIVIAAALSLAVATAQKKPLTHDVYDSWKALGSITLSHDGKWVMFVVSPQEGDNVVEVQATDGTKMYKFDRGSNVRFTEDGKFGVATILPKREDTLKATRDKVKPEDRPKNDLYILDLATGQGTTVEKVASYSLATKGSTWIVYPP